MKKQKICIIGGGLTGLITAITLSKLNLSIDLITDNTHKIVKSNRTVAISQDNYDFLRKLNIFKLSKKRDFWPCAKMKIYTKNKNEQFDEIFEFNRQKKIKKHILYMIENSALIKKIIFSIKKNKLIKLITKKKVNEIISSKHLKSVKLGKKYTKYNLIIICTGVNSRLIKKNFKDETLERSYNEVSITTTINHSPITNNIARQIFLSNEILAFLPLSNKRTSIVWTINKNIFNKYKKKGDSFLKNELKFRTDNFFKKIKFTSSLQHKEPNLFIRKKYFQDRILLFGDALHVVHPFVGQGFNMTLRDLINLQILLQQKINLGLDVGASDILSEFSNRIKPENFVYSLGIDFLKNIFSYEKIELINFRNKMINRLNNNNFAKNLFFNIANKGVRF